MSISGKNRWQNRGLTHPRIQLLGSLDRQAFLQLGHFALEACDGLLQADGLKKRCGGQWAQVPGQKVSSAQGIQVRKKIGEILIEQMIHLRRRSKIFDLQVLPGDLGVGMCWLVLEGCQRITRINSGLPVPLTSPPTAPFQSMSMSSVLWHWDCRVTFPGRSLPPG